MTPCTLKHVNYELQGSSMYFSLLKKIIIPRKPNTQGSQKVETIPPSVSAHTRGEWLCFLYGWLFTVNVLNITANGSDHQFYAICTNMFYVCILYMVQIIIKKLCVEVLSTFQGFSPLAMANTFQREKKQASKQTTTKTRQIGVSFYSNYWSGHPDCISDGTVSSCMNAHKPLK